MPGKRKQPEQFDDESETGSQNSNAMKKDQEEKEETDYEYSDEEDDISLSDIVAVPPKAAASVEQSDGSVNNNNNNMDIDKATIPTIRNETMTRDQLMERLCRGEEGKELYLAAYGAGIDYSLRTAADYLQDDKEVVMAAVSVDGTNLQFASLRLQGHLDIAQAACENTVQAMRYLRPGSTRDFVAQDKALLKKALLCNVISRDYYLEQAPKTFYLDMTIVRFLLRGRELERRTKCPLGLSLQEWNDQVTDDRLMVGNDEEGARNASFGRVVPLQQCNDLRYLMKMVVATGRVGHVPWKVWRANPMILLLPAALVATAHWLVGPDNWEWLGNNCEMVGEYLQSGGQQQPYALFRDLIGRANYGRMLAKYDWRAVQYLAPHLRSDPYFIRQAVAYDGRVFQYALGAARQDAKTAVKAIVQSHARRLGSTELLRSLSSEERTELLRYTTRALDTHWGYIHMLCAVSTLRRELDDNMKLNVFRGNERLLYRVGQFADVASTSEVKQLVSVRNVLAAV